MNFALILLVCAVVSGSIYLLDVLCFARRRNGSQTMPKVIEYARSFFPLFILVLCVRSFLIEPFRIPSGSLEPTLLVGDFVAVNKFAYGLRLPVLEKKIIALGQPQRGDVTVFRWPPDPSFDYIKRVIGVPGDHIEYHDKKLTINGTPIPQRFIQYTTDESSGNPVAQYEEVINGIKHAIFIRKDVAPFDFEIDVPAGAYFMMGDNRDDSADSRYWGFVFDEYLRGKAFLVWMSWNGQQSTIRWKHLGHMIH
ncbi:MAG: signal peptidase I [Legionellaceae bacterium]